MEQATLAGGCFWCTEAIFKRVKGVTSVVSGYSGGTTGEPSYYKVSAGSTGHAETIQINFDPKIISYEKLLEIFFKLHDPTTLNQQGADIGSQYRSIIFYHNPAQEKIAREVKDKIVKSGLYHNPLVTEIVPFENFYQAEGMHQDFYTKNPNSAYCQIVIDPKIKKLLENFKNETT